ncbi:alkanesulfonate monooxygenase SsuD/methylene tetrahydromethanopterin reductase-like flavin-dependent oxidoreductase (luciferase family) [Microvirga flocculans]|uniref:Alkanesulfonate monooxygenase SsuD/methylene tetrahydromethanopterin reductase-like flavin-dependent oxidoreductase (Luciferase family) n=1 Tax=Microvirga flocculans TaxID=217168 RepID=A0A7W6IC54_9HYPH|nr:LLM class flavin-dependent oxidoreductase [Microvirga flocculans]MBB4038441.1 alkanesulfonate monooxygenase SsuD/methylene tetrahydromethanopterin reductase-like flavin-dependent oxidoreductase (luciferase family) [Microvirga flocculans]
MSLGIFNLMTLRDHPDGVAGVIADTREMVSLAEEIGFETAWFAEHHFTNYSVSVSPLMMAAHMAGYTKRIKLGAGVVVLPLYHPLRVAQEIALLDQQTDGRAVLGVGTGYQKYEFERFGADVDAKTDVFLEYWSVVEQALVEGRVEFAGRYIQVPDTVFTLRPVQKPLPPVFVTSPHPQILSRLAKWGGVPFITAGWRGSPALPGVAEQVRKSWVAGGLDPERMPLAIQQYIHVTDSREEAREAGERARYVARLVLALRESSIDLSGSLIDAPPLPDEPPVETFVGNLIIGDVQHVAERIVAEFRKLRPVHYNCFFQFGGMPIARARRSLERFGAEVLPLVEREVGPLRRSGSILAPVFAAE